MWTVLLSILAVLTAVYFYIFKSHKHWEKLKVPYVKPYPVVGNMLEFFFRKETFNETVKRLYNTQPENRVLGLYFLHAPLLMIRDLNLIKQIGIKDFDHFTDHVSMLSEDIEPILSKTLFLLQGQKWRHMRATLSPAFTSSKMKAMFVLIAECANQFTNYFENVIDPNKPYELELKDNFSRFANDVIATTAFGIQCNSLKDKDNEFYLMGKDFTNFGGIKALKMFGYQISKKMMQLLRLRLFSKELSDFFRNIIKTNIADREREGIIRPDMIHLLMEARRGKLKHEVQKDEDAGFATVEEFDVGKEVTKARLELSDDDVTAQALLFFVAALRECGFESISTTMCHMSYELAQQPDIQERLQEEIDEALQQSNGKISYDLVMKLKYLDMVVSETLRKWPAVVVLDRVCNTAYTIQPELPGETPVELKKGDVIWIPSYPIHYDPKYYPDPEKFDPERFNDDNKGSIDPMSYIPFGVGPRNCIGSRFALMEAKIMLVHLLSQFSIGLTEKSVVPIQIKKGQFNLVPENRFWVTLKKRTNN